MSFTKILENMAGLYDNNSMISRSSISGYQKLQRLLVRLLFLTPLLFVTNTNELYEFPKMFAVYILGTTIIFIFLLNLLFNPKPLKLPNIFVLVFVFSQVLALVFSSHLYTSLWGYYSRFNDGFISILVFFGLYIVFINEEKVLNIRNNISVFLITLVPISVYGIYQHFRPVVRIYSTIGQPNWLAAYIGMLVPVIWYYFFKTKSAQKIYLLALIYALAFAAFWYTYSLSGILGIMAGSVVFFLHIRHHISVKKAGLLAFITLIISLGSPGIFSQRIHDVYADARKLLSQNIEAHIRVYAQNSQKQEQTSEYNLSDPGFIRTLIWKSTIRLITSNPKVVFLGTGPETFPYIFQKFRDPGLNNSSEWDYILNKPHNYYLEIAAESGVLGLISYLALIIYSLKKSQSYVRTSLVVLYVTNFFGWPTVSTALLFWTWLALIYEKN